MLLYYGNTKIGSDSLVEIDIIENTINKSKITFTLNTTFWKSVNSGITSFLHSNPAWDEIKFLDENGDLNSRINTVPNDTGGIYLFIVKPDVLPDFHNYLMYIGRSHTSDSRNLRKRIREYYNDERINNKRPKVHRMLNSWGEYLYIKYLPLYNYNDSDIDKIEVELINSLLPPCNDKIPCKLIRDAVKAYSL